MVAIKSTTSVHRLNAVPADLSVRQSRLSFYRLLTDIQINVIALIGSYPLLPPVMGTDLTRYYWGLSCASVRCSVLVCSPVPAEGSTLRGATVR